MRNIIRVLMVGCVLSLCGHVHVAKGETPGERFRKAIEREAEYCATHKIKPTNRRCDITKLQPADPLATEEGSFAHSIKIPNPVPEDSGYKPGMTSQEYFDHLCKTEAGEFIYKTVEDVDGVYQMRPRDEVSQQVLASLFVLEDVYGYDRVEATEPENHYVGPQKYQFFETPRLVRPIQEWQRKYLHSSMFSKAQQDSKYVRYYGYDGRDMKTMEKEHIRKRKSQYGYTWRGILRPHAQELGVVGGELIVMDLLNNEVLAVRRGYVSGDLDPSRPGMTWGRPCPLQDEGQFLLKVVKPAKHLLTSKGGSNGSK